MGGAIVPTVECERCDESLYEYRWLINGVEVGAEPTFTYRDEDVGYPQLRIEVTGRDGLNQTATAYSAYHVSVVQRIESSPTVLAALKSDGSVVTWGNGPSGGYPGYRDPQTYEWIPVDLSSGVMAVYGISSGAMGLGSFAAIKEDGSVVAWGNDYFGGYLAYQDPQTSEWIPVTIESVLELVDTSI